MIDVTNDELLEVKRLANQVFGKRISPATLYRWIRKGANGVKLEAVKVGRKWFTTKSAFRQFFEAQTAAAGACPTDVGKHQCAVDVTDEELAACKLI